MQTAVAAPAEKSLAEKEPWLAASLSWALPGAGHLYAHLWTIGVALIVLRVVLSAGAIAMLIDPRVPLPALAPMLLASIALHIGASAIAFRAVRKQNTTESENARRQAKDPWLAVFLSVILPGLGHLYLRKWLAGIGFILASLLLRAWLGRAVWGLVPYVGLHVVALLCAYRAAPGRRESGRSPIVPVVTFLAVFWLADVATTWVLQSHVAEFVIAGGPSMTPTIPNNARVAVNKLLYQWQEPAVGDVILFVPPGHPSVTKTRPLTKRIVAVGGETVQIRNGLVLVDGHYCEPEGTPHRFLRSRSPSPKRSPWDTYGIIGPYRVPEGCYYVLGDNRANSLDSRDFGAIPRENILGKTVRVLWPLNTPPLYR